MKFWSVYSIQLRIELIYSPIVGDSSGGREEDRGKIFTTTSIGRVYSHCKCVIGYTQYTLYSLLHRVNCLRLLGVLILI